jgi:SAM-dependent methyltransferase
MAAVATANLTHLEQQVVKRGVNLGCGLNLCLVAGWDNLDNSPIARLSQYPRIHWFLKKTRLLPQPYSAIHWPPQLIVRDATRGLPYPDDSVEIVYSSHLLEHLSPRHAQGLLKECYRVLVPRGIIRLVVPDLEKACRDYLSALQESSKLSRNQSYAPYKREAEPPAETLLNYLQLVPSSEPEGPLMRLARSFLDRNGHKWMYDRDSLHAGLAAAGFLEIVPQQFGVSAIPEIKELDIPARASESLYMEARKPATS